MKSRQEKPFMVKNANLEKELRQKTLELSKKTLELKIEIGLEKVRTVAMKMKQPKDMIDICCVISRQLQLLKIENIRNVQTAIINDKKGTYLNYEYFTQYKTTSVLEIETRLHPRVQKFVSTIKKSADAFFTTGFKGRELRKWSQYRKQTGQNADPMLDKAKSLHYYFYSIGPGALGLSTYVPLTKEEIKIFHRFRNVFDLAYKRFTDIEKAIAQAREAQIEASLEKVRASAMSMIKSGDLLNVCYTLYKEFRHFGFPELRNAMINIHNDAEKTFVNYDYSDEMGRSINPLTYNIHPVIEKQIKHIRSANDAFSETVFEGDDLKSWKKFRRRIGEKDDPRIKNSKALYYYFYSIGEGSIGISTFSEIGAGKLQLLRRFRNVFSLAYQRYADIAKAEVQAKETQIELSLERVRARTLAMQKSDEMQDATLVLFRQFKELGVTPAQASICIFDNEVKNGEMYVTLKGEKIDRSFTMDLDKEAIVMKKVRKAFLDKQKYFSMSVTGKKLQDYNRWRNTLVGLHRWDESAAVRKQSWNVYTAFFSSGMIGISYDSPVSAEAQKILERFTRVFDGTYTRFLDLQNAEAQAKESQIELALERVRARTMAMQRSDELSETSLLLFQQFKELGEQVQQLSIGIMKEEEGVVDISATFHGSQFHQAYKIEIYERFVMKKLIAAWKAQKRSTVVELAGQELHDYNKWRSKLSGIDFNEHAGDRWIVNVAFFSKGMLSFSTHENVPQESIQLLERFASVFDQTYTRFLDLQKAEAQIREAKIEAALERTRTQSMIMQHSKELDDTLRVFHEQVLLLGIPSAFSFLWLPDEEKDRHIFWAAWAEKLPAHHFGKNDSTVFNSKAINYPLDRNEPATVQCLVDWKGNEPVVSYHVPPSGVENYFAAWQELIAGVEQLNPEYFTGGLYYVEAFMKYGCFGVMIKNPLPEEEKKILARFAIEFERAYTRFLDLQKAEVQARESQIELALERVRARTMAMQRSDELKDAAALLFQQVKALGAPAYSCGYNIWEKNEKEFTSWMSTQDGSIINGVPNIPLTEDANFIRYVESKQKGEQFFVLELRGERMQEHYQYLKTIPAFKAYFDYAVSVGFDLPETQIHYLANFSHGNLLFITLEPCPEFHDVFKRFAAVFEQTYTRFLDLQKAEAQAKEGQIQLAMERVRARTMAMQKSDELPEAANLLFQQVQSLGMPAWSAGYCTWDEDKRAITLWMSSEGVLQPPFRAPLTEDPSFINMREAHERGETFFVDEIGGEELKAHYKYMRTLPVVGEILDSIIEAGHPLPTFQIFHLAYFSQGFLLFITYEPVPGAHDIFKRFGKVFDQTYTRFLDLQKAEAQAREAQIEASLERVRAKAMAMHNSSDLSEAAGTVFTEFNKLGINPIRTGFVLLTKDSRKAKLYPATSFDKENTVSFTGEFEFTGHPVFEKQYESWQKKENYFPVLEDEVLKSYYKILSEGLSVPYQNFPTDKKQFGSFLPFTEGFLFTWSDEPYTGKEINILERFKAILDLTIRRYIDLKTAEAQAREAKIEAALERVRAKAMAMHSSKDLAEALSVFYRELKSLSVTPRRCGVALMDKETKMTELTTMNTTEQGDSIEVIGHIKMAGHPVLDGVFENWLVQKEYHTVLRGNQIKEYYQVLKPQISYPDYSHDVVQYGYYFMFNEGDVYSWTDKELTDDDLKIYRRFTSVISLTYKRYQDLQQAEAQAREAKIEAALERVRAKAMAMHKTNDLNDAVTIVFDELEKLNLGMIRCGIGILSKEKRCAEVWTTTVAEQGRITQVSGDESMDIHPLLMGAFDAWLQQGDFSYVLEGDDMSDYYRAVRETNFHLPESQIMVEHAVELKHYYYGTAFESGMLFAFCETDFSDEAKSVMKRFAGVFNLTYKRFLDIQNAEAQAREALIEVALERVRSRTLAMQRSDELAETAAVLFRQLIALGIEPNCLYIGIIKDDSGDIEAWATDEYGGKVSTMFTLNANSNASVKKMFDGWKEQHKSINIDMQGQELQDYFHYLGEDLKVPFKPGPSQKRRVQNIAYFSKGFIGLASPESQPEATTNLLERFAGVFNLTYTRFNDLQIAEQHAEQAKLDLIKLQFEKRAENALTELRTTQAQLIQSEKMASLGELTAGIAHEIKNPLNFVNNFSDLSTDLVDEFVNTKDESERKELAEDLKKNLTIISEHGRRADSIVKNMLEHSRTGSGKKQLTDINQLCIEFFNLAYHGNRANIPDFNCEMKKELAPDLPKINVVSQDISRVLLNLFNNAFYAVNEKSLKSKVHGSKNKYKPIVELITKLSNQQIIIMVRDNGNGIPNHIKEKIFEPFFTTKPAGQGTGLGLSLSYDIITNGHGGELKVETKEGEGSTFIIVLLVD